MDENVWKRVCGRKNYFGVVKDAEHAAPDNKTERLMVALQYCQYCGQVSWAQFRAIMELLSADTDVSLAVKCPMCEVISLETKKIRLLDFADFCRMTHYYWTDDVIKPGPGGRWWWVLWNLPSLSWIFIRRWIRADILIHWGRFILHIEVKLDIWILHYARCAIDVSHTLLNM